MSDTVDFSAIAANVTERLESASDTPAAEAVDTPDVPAVPDQGSDGGDLGGSSLTAPQEPPADPPAPADDAEPDVFDDEKVQSFDRDYVTKLRGKEARYRTELRETQEQWKPWQETLAALNPEEQGLARELVASILQGDLARATEIIGRDALAEALGAPAVPDSAAGAPADPNDAPLTRAEAERMWAEREAAQAKERELAEVFEHAEKLGYNPKSEPGTPEFGRWTMLVQHAQAAGSLEAGHKALQAAEAAERQRIIDEYVASRSPGSPAPAAPAGAAAREPDGAWLEKGGNPLNAATRRAMDRLAGDRSQVG